MYSVLLSQYCIFGFFEKITSYCNFVYFFIHLITLNCLSQKQPPEMFYKKRVLEKFAKFTEKHLCQSLSFNKVAFWGLLTLLKKETLAQVFSCEQLFYRTPLNHWFYCHQAYIILMLNWRFTFLALKNLVFQNFTDQLFYYWSRFKLLYCLKVRQRTVFSEVFVSQLLKCN